MENKIYVTRTSMPTYEEYIEMIKPLWDSHWLTNMGSFHQELEQKLKEYLGVPEVSLMVNGHMSLELVIQAMGFPEGGEVITTPFTFVSTTHAIVRNRLKPVFCDIKTSDYTIDEDKIEELITDKTVAILPVHVYGNVCNVEKIQEIADKYGLKVIYDAAHAFGETYKGTGIGNYGDASVFSFHATKVFNTIEGGAVTFADRQLYEKLYNLKNFGIRSEEVVEAVGANAKMNEFCAAMGLCNLSHIEENVSLRKEKVLCYNGLLSSQERIVLPRFNREDVRYNYAYYPIIFRTNADSGIIRNRVYQVLKDSGIYTRKYFYPITSDEECYRGRYLDASVDNARDISKNVLVLPLYPELEIVMIQRICDIICQEMKREDRV